MSRRIVQITTYNLPISACCVKFRLLAIDINNRVYIVSMTNCYQNSRNITPHTTRTCKNL